jgi:hypothetical protein
LWIIAESPTVPQSHCQPGQRSCALQHPKPQGLKPFLPGSPGDLELRLSTQLYTPRGSRATAITIGGLLLGNLSAGNRHDVTIAGVGEHTGDISFNADAACAYDLTAGDANDPNSAMRASSSSG